jgi:hypothetical protein
MNANVKPGDIIYYKTTIGKKNAVRKWNWKPGTCFIENITYPNGS